MAMLEDYKGYCPKCGNKKGFKTGVSVANEIMATVYFECKCGNQWAVNYYGPPQIVLED